MSIAQVASIIGFLSAVVLFLASLGGWSFARGVAATIPLPARLFGIRPSFEAFSSVVVQNVGAFVTAGGFGAGMALMVDVEGWAQRFAFIALAQLLMLTLLLAGVRDVDKRPSSYRILTFASGFAPAVVAFLTVDAESEKFRAVLLATFCPGLPLIYALRLYTRGKMAAAEITTLTDLTPRLHERALSAVKQSDYPLLTLCTKEALLVRVPVLQHDTQFRYYSQANAFMKFLASDDTYVYVVANVEGVVESVAIAKATITQMAFSRVLAEEAMTA